MLMPLLLRFPSPESCYSSLSPSVYTHQVDSSSKPKGPLSHVLAHSSVLLSQVPFSWDPFRLHTLIHGCSSTVSGLSASSGEGEVGRSIFASPTLDSSSVEGP